jgi:hypothetical protein
VAAALISRLEMGSRFISPWNTRYIQVPDTGQLCSAPFNHGSLPTSRYFKIFQEKCGPSNSGSNCRSKSNRLVLPNLRLAIQHQDIREAVDYGVIKMNIDTDTQWSYWNGIRDFEAKYRDYLQKLGPFSLRG